MTSAGEPTQPITRTLHVPHALGGPRCSTGSALRAESLAATASLGRRWLLVEIAGGWGWRAFVDSPALDPDLGHELVARAESEGMRIAAIRRPGRARGAGRWRYAVVDTLPGQERIAWGEVGAAAELAHIPLDGSAATPSADPLIAVCAHGRHDECCAVRGRRVASDLAEAYPDWTWESSHIGGDRFAATMLLFPHGLNFGRVDHADSIGIVEQYLAGGIAPTHYRGRTGFDRVEQAAQHAARETFGDDRLDAWQPLARTATDAGWQVELAGADGVVLVDVVEQATVPMYSTCAATQLVPLRTYRATAIRTAAHA